MTNYYVSDRGNNSNNGLTTTTAKLTLGAANTLATSAGDFVYIQGGSVFRETLTNASGGSTGNPISWIGDISGKIFGDSGGRVRITGSDNDQTRTRTTAINTNTKHFLTFQDLYLDGCSSSPFNINGSHNITGRRIYVVNTNSVTGGIIAQNSWFALTLDGCIVYNGYAGAGIYMTDSAAPHVATIDNCVVLGSHDTVGFWLKASTSINLRNCLAIGCSFGYYQSNVGATHTALRCLAYNNRVAYQADDASKFTVDYSAYDSNGTNLGGSVVDGGHNVSYPIMLEPTFSPGGGFSILNRQFELLSDCAYRDLAATGSAPTTDMYGVARPQGVNGSWGPTQPTNVSSVGGSGGINLLGRGFKDFEVICPTAKTLTVSCTVSWTDNVNIAVKPQLQLLDEVGTVLSTSNASGTGSGETLSVSSSGSFGIDRLFTARISNLTTYGTPGLSVIAIFNDPTAV